MSTTTQYITVTERATITMQLPRTIHNLSDPQTIEACAHHFWQFARNKAEWHGGSFPFPLMRLVVDAMVEGGAVTCEYTNERGESRARTLFPFSVHLTADNRIETRAYDTYRQETRSFRLDRITGAHAVTLPCDAPASVAA